MAKPVLLVTHKLPEAIEAPRRRFVLGVQWHPEADEQSRVVDAIVEQARRYRKARVELLSQLSSLPW